jgi:hypothetical protein
MNRSHIMRDILQQFFRRSDGTTVCILACFTAAILFAACSSPATAASESSEPVYNVMSPMGESTVKMTSMAPRIDTLAGKTICMVWNNAFKSDVTLPAIGQALKKQYPDLKVVQYTDLPNAFLPEPPGTPRKQSEALQTAYRLKGCNAVVTGNGG